jgi:putative intracellular protease/amidase
MIETTTEPTAWVVVAEGWADHQTALTCAEIAAHGRIRIRYAGLAVEPIVSATGLRVLPDCTVDEINADGAVILILPGGPLWVDHDAPAVTAAIRTFREREIPIAAIGSGTLVLARAGVLGGVRHTSNSLAWLKEHVPEYRDDLHYVNVIDVADGGLVTKPAPSISRTRSSSCSSCATSPTAAHGIACIGRACCRSGSEAAAGTASWLGLRRRRVSRWGRGGFAGARREQI